MSDVVSEDAYKLAYTRVCRLLDDIDILREYYRQFPVLYLVSSAVKSSRQLRRRAASDARGPNAGLSPADV